MNDYKSLRALIYNSFTCKEAADALFKKCCDIVDLRLSKLLKEKVDPIYSDDLSKLIGGIIQDTMPDEIKESNPEGFSYRLSFAELVKKMPTSSERLIRHLGGGKWGKILLIHQKSLTIICSDYCNK